MMFYVEPPRRPCHQCGRRVLSGVAQARYCKPCRNIRRELSRTVPRVPRGGSTHDATHHCGRLESVERVDRMLEEARAARLAEERRTGQRRYTITDGWAQRPGRSTLDGEMRVLEVGGE
jgi:hypothetical protein